MSEGLKLHKSIGDDNWTIQVYERLWEDRQEGGNGLTKSELVDFAVAVFNTSGTIQWWEEARIGQWENSRRSEDLRPISGGYATVERDDPHWRDVCHAKVSDVLGNGMMLARLAKKYPDRARTALLFTTGRSTGRPKSGELIRYRINEIDGKPVKPRIYQPRRIVAERWIEWDPDDQKAITRAHIDGMNWLAEARNALNNPKTSNHALRELLKRAVAVIEAKP